MSQRASAMHGNAQQDMVHKSVTDQALLKMELEKINTVRVQPDQFNYRSPKKYVSAASIVFYDRFLISLPFFVDANFNLLQRLADEQSVRHGWQNATLEVEHQVKKILAINTGNLGLQVLGFTRNCSL